MIKGRVRSIYLLQLQLLDGQQADVEWWAFAMQSPLSCCLEQVSGDKNDASYCFCIPLLLLNTPPWQQPTTHPANKGTNGLHLRAIGSTWFITFCFSTRPFGIREEKMLSGGGQHRLGIYHFVSLHCNSNCACRGQFLLSTKQPTSGNYIRASA